MTSSFSTWLVATFNKGKQQEIAAYLAEFNIRTIGGKSLLSQPPFETGSALKDNALLKAQAYCSLTDCPILADDSGLVIPALGGFPGVNTADYVNLCGSYDQAFKDLKERLKDKKHDAFFMCILVVIDRLKQTHFFEGEVTGHLVFPARGKQGFGFGPIFQPTGSLFTLGEMDLKQRTAHNHRGRALSSLGKALKEGGIAL